MTIKRHEAINDLLAGGDDSDARQKIYLRFFFRQ